MSFRPPRSIRIDDRVSFWKEVESLQVLQSGVNQIMGLT